ncbi:hypothetical protein OGATHE_001196 [Ogataea polymorpha]|uniref:Uncharacterized protein n=1 Tax=Ogataea polymorpha TaxID=460523 RepID=A0A9P8PSC0_9ASCO|nr:hypothetical protein OGATHE_001196 [Ogataea polymorpha]
MTIPKFRLESELPLDVDVLLLTRLSALCTPTNNEPCDAIPDGTWTKTAGSMIETVMNDPLEKTLLNDLSSLV